MDINNLQQLNSFLSGMNTDISDSILDSKYYRYAENIRIVTNKDHNEGEARLIEGTSLIKLLYIQYGSRTKILAITSIRNYVIVIIKSDDVWYILRNTNCGIGDYDELFGPCRTQIWNDENSLLSIVTRYESDNNIKLYIADQTGNKGIMCCNIADTGDNTNLGSDINILVGYLSTFIPKPVVEVSQNMSGQLLPARVQYTYRLYKRGGGVTNLSPFSEVLSLYKDNKTGYSNTESTTKAVNIKIPAIPEKANILNNIQIFRITYVLNGQLPTVVLIFDREIDLSTDTNIVDSGANDIQTMAVSELLSAVQMDIFPKVIESKDDYLFAANVVYNQDNIDKKFKDIDTTSITSGNIDNVYLHRQFDGSAASRDYNPLYWQKPSGVGYGGTGEYFDWEYCSKQYTVTIDDFGNHSAQHHSLRRDETYRYGVILYDSKGRKSSVKWIADIRIPPYNSVVGLPTPYRNGDSYNLFDIGIKFTLKKNIDDCSACEIVRCIRTDADKSIISQGIVGQPLLTTYYRENETEPTSDMYYPSGFISMQSMEVNNGVDKSLATSVYSTNAKDIIQFASPEYIYAPGDFKDRIKGKFDQLYFSHAIDYDIDGKWMGTSQNYYKVGNNTYKNGIWFKYGTTGNLLYTGDCATSAVNAGEEGPIPFIKLNKRGNIYFNCVQASTRSRQSYSPDFGYTSSIKEVIYPSVPEWNAFSDNLEIRFLDDTFAINDKMFTQWSTPLFANADLTAAGHIRKLFGGYEAWNTTALNSCSYGIGTGGAYALFALNHDVEPWKYTPSPVYGKLLPITVANLKKNAIPYGGHNKEAIESSVYYSFGDCFTLDNFENQMDMYVYDGDCVNMLFVYNALHNWYHPQYVTPFKMGTVYIVPIESDVDLRATFGDIFTKEKTKYYYQQDKASSFDGYIQERDAYMYNSGYSANPNVLQYTTIRYTEISNDNFDTRIHASNQKTNGEDIDSWLQFKSANFIDVDSRYGEITDMRLFKTKLVCWQSNATSILSVNDRILLNTSTDLQITLGTGGILDRFDYISTVYGMKPNLFADAQSNTTLYWWDGINKEIVCYNRDGVNPLSLVKNIKNYINSYQENSRPFLLYDNKYKEIVCSVVNDESIVYSENPKAFTSVYKFMPIAGTVSMERIIVTDNQNIYEYNKEYEPGHSRLFITDAYPRIDYVVNNQSMYNKTFDTTIFGGRFYGGNELNNLIFTYSTPLKQKSETTGLNAVTNIEYDYRLAIPRDLEGISESKVLYGNRMRGKTMQCEFKSNSNSTDFSLQYIITKYRMSWS